MIKAVIDTNVLLGSIPKTGENRWVYDLFVRNEFIWIFSNEIISEYAEVMSREFNSQVADIVFSILLVAPNTLRKEPYFNWQLVENDPDDNKFVDCTIAANADYLVTKDKHLLRLSTRTKPFPQVPVIEPSDFKKLFF